MDYRIIDCDQHVIEPPDLWEKYLPKKFADQAPKLAKDEDGGDGWLLGEHVESLGLVAAMNQTPKTLKWTGVRYDELHPGITQPAGRLELMDEDGVSAAVFFPPQRTMIYFMFAEDPEYQVAGMQAYNNFISDFVSHCPERLGAIWQMPASGIEAAVAELRRAKESGAVGVGLATWPSGEFLLSKTDDEFWAVANEMGMPVHIHVGLTPPQYKTMRVATKKGGAAQLVAFASTMSRMPTLFAELIFTGVFERFPSLTVVGGEVGAGWVPFLKQELDDRYRRNRYWCEVELTMLPSEYYMRNCKVGFVRDHYGVRNCDAVGVDTMMWTSDFPHHITDWPNSRYLIDEMSQGISAEAKRKLFCENAGKLYGFLK
ncbi:MAG: amidohydrolase [Deltaproteobacteria bacterium]|nr:amidohydrolase [Deltaproteobacteria bacterium]MBW2418452.1 amidohydrolase [Deltaproteobacteria bacterium]